MSSVDDLAKMQADGRPEPVFGQGVLTAWNGGTFENTVFFRQATWRNLSVAQNFDGLSLQAGDNVLLGRLDGDDTSSWFIMGRMDVPPLAEPVRIVSGDVIVASGASIRVDDGGDVILNGGDLRVIGGGELRSENFDGDTNADDPGTTGFALGNNKLAMAGVFVPAIDTDAVGATNTGFGLTTSFTEKVSASVTVPGWAQTASVIATGFFAAQNSSASTDSFECELRIDGDPSISPTTPDQDAGFTEWFTVPHNRVFSVSGSGSFDITGHMRSIDHSWPTDPNTAAVVSAMIIFRSAQ